MHTKISLRPQRRLFPILLPLVSLVLAGCGGVDTVDEAADSTPSADEQFPVEVLSGPVDGSKEVTIREEPARIVVDLRRVTFMDSIGLGILLAHLLRGRKVGRELMLVQGPRQIQDLFTLTGTLDKFDWVPAPS